MPSRLNWTQEEDLLLKHLRSSLKIKSWQEISDKLNEKFDTSERSAKQCRERFSNNAQFCGEGEENNPWNEGEDQILFELYLEYGPRWTIFMKHFNCRSENSIKNRFYSCLRKTARKMREFEGKIIESERKSIKYEMLVTVLDLANKVGRESEKMMGLKAYENLNLFVMRRIILQICFKDPKLESQEIIDVVKGLHKINSYFRALGIFKTKKKGEWELTEKRLQFILSFESSLNFDFIDKGKCEKEVKTEWEKRENNLEETVEISDHFKVEEQSICGFHEIWDFEKQICEMLGYKYEFNLNEGMMG